MSCLTTWLDGFDEVLYDLVLVTVKAESIDNLINGLPYSMAGTCKLSFLITDSWRLTRRGYDDVNRLNVFAVDVKSFSSS